MLHVPCCQRRRSFLLDWLIPEAFLLIGTNIPMLRMEFLYTQRSRHSLWISSWDYCRFVRQQINFKLKNKTEPCRRTNVKEKNFLFRTNQTWKVNAYILQFIGMQKKVYRDVSKQEKYITAFQSNLDLKSSNCGNDIVASPPAFTLCIINN